MCSPLDSTFFIVKGKTSPIDLSKYETQSESYISFLTHSWGIIADIDIESEALRFLGSTRFDLWGALRVLSLRRYRAKFSYLPVESSGRIVHVDKLPPLTNPLPSEWKTIEDDFILFWASHVTHAGQNTLHAPHVGVADGYFTIQIVRYVKRASRRVYLWPIVLSVCRSSFVKFVLVSLISRWSCLGAMYRVFEPRSF